MSQFRKRALVIDAVRYNGGIFDEMPGWLRSAFESGHVWTAPNGTPPLTIKTLEGEITASPGDWIIRGIQGELYPCKPDIFSATYEHV